MSDTLGNQGYIHVHKILFKISLCSLYGLIRDKTVGVYGIFSLKAECGVSEKPVWTAELALKCSFIKL